MYEKEFEKNIILGRNAVMELIKSGNADKVVIQRELRHDKALSMIIAAAKSKSVPIADIDKRRLDEFSKGLPHQGVAAYEAQQEYCSLEDIIKEAELRNEKPFIVVCDGINDPHNLGAVIRSAECCGVHGVIIPKRSSAGVTPVTVKASAGATAHMKIARVANIASTIEEMKKLNIWVYGVETGGGIFYKTDITGAAAFVLGSEGEGISRLVRERCDHIISIPMYGKINSLNVSAAAAIVLTEAAKQRNGAE